MCPSVYASGGRRSSTSGRVAPAPASISERSFGVTSSCGFTKPFIAASCHGWSYVETREVGAHGLAGRIEQPRAQRRIDAGHDLVHLGDSLLHEIGDLAMASFSVHEVFVDHRERLLDRRSMCRQQPGRAEAADAAQRSEVLPEVASPARGDDDGPTEPDEITAVDFVRAFIEETEVIRR